jgi:hypothetical protein
MNEIYEPKKQISYLPDWLLEKVLHKHPDHEFIRKELRKRKLKNIN